MNISVPDDLKQQMDKLQDVNWSRVAAEAFEKKVAELSPKKGSRTAFQFGLDLFIAENLFGWKVGKEDWSERAGQPTAAITSLKDKAGRPRNVSEVPHYSTDESAMNDAIGTAHRKGIYFQIQAHQSGEYLVRAFNKGKTKFATADHESEIPEAVCKLFHAFLTEE